MGALREVERTDQVLQRASSAQKLDLDMESGVRGFLVAGDERFLRYASEPPEEQRAALCDEAALHNLHEISE